MKFKHHEVESLTAWTEWIYPYQRKMLDMVLESKGKLIIHAPRQIGKSIFWAEFQKIKAQFSQAKEGE